MQKKNLPLILIILDGFGHREEVENNAILSANTPNWDYLWKTYPHTLISGSGNAVGLPHGQMGNSEVGHLNMGAGRIIYQDLSRIDHAIASQEFFQNPILLDALKKAKKNKKAVHLMGLLSPGGVHSHENHMHAMVEFAAKLHLPSLYIHAFLDGRDTPPKSAMASIERIEACFKQFNLGKIASLIGRYYAMDRDQRWDRIEKAYNLLVQGKAKYHAPSAKEGLALAYAQGETDEFINPTSIHPANHAPYTIEDGDVVIFMNFRSDRAREITEAFVAAQLHGFIREKVPHLGAFVCLSEYDKRFAVPVAFPSQSIENIFAECISREGMKQLRIAETEKYAHVTFFFNGGIEAPFPGEERILIPSAKVATYDLQPEMSAFLIADQLVELIKTRKYDVMICNFANADMVGHSGNFPATVKAIEALDLCLGKIVKALTEVGGEALITADHGNAEQMFDYSTNQPHTAHTNNPIPLIYIGRPAVFTKNDGKLSDISPTLLYLMNLPQPKEMTGKTLVKLV